jgi:hypothetical protein
MPAMFPLAGYMLAILGFPYNFLPALSFLAKIVWLIYRQKCFCREQYGQVITNLLQLAYD